MEDFGEFKDNKLNGQGTWTGYNGDIYVGELKEGKFHGQGTLTHSNGDTYVGEFKDGKFNGQGTLTMSTTVAPRSGKYKTNPRPYQRFFKYVGEFKDGKFNGHGTLIRSIKYKTNPMPNPMPDSTERKYVGDWKDGKENGQGIATFSGGGTYVGELRTEIIMVPKPIQVETNTSVIGMMANRKK